MKTANYKYWSQGGYYIFYPNDTSADLPDNLKLHKYNSRGDQENPNAWDYIGIIPFEESIWEYYSNEDAEPLWNGMVYNLNNKYILFVFEYITPGNGWPEEINECILPEKIYLKEYNCDVKDKNIDSIYEKAAKLNLSEDKLEEYFGDKLFRVNRYIKINSIREGRLIGVEIGLYKSGEYIKKSSICPEDCLIDNPMLDTRFKFCSEEEFNKVYGETISSFLENK